MVSQIDVLDAIKDTLLATLPVMLILPFLQPPSPEFVLKDICFIKDNVTNVQETVPLVRPQLQPVPDVKLDST